MAPYEQTKNDEVTHHLYSSTHLCLCPVEWDHMPTNANHQHSVNLASYSRLQSLHLSICKMAMKIQLVMGRLLSRDLSLGSCSGGRRASCLQAQNLISLWTKGSKHRGLRVPGAG